MYYMRKFLLSYKFHAAVFFIALGFFCGTAFSARSQESESFRFLDNFHFVYQTIKSDYVDAISPRKLFEGAIRGMLQSLEDPYSRFLDENEYKEFREEVTGKFVGIGVEVSIRDGEIVVVSPIEDTPAKKAGLRSGDIIINVDGTFTRGKQLQEIIKNLKGLPGSKVKLLVRREGFNEPLEFNIDRTTIEVSSVKSGIMKEDPSVGYLRITHFFAKTVPDCERALAEFNNKKISKLVLDLRDNPGGDFDAAIKIANLFIEQGKVIVSTRGRENSNIKEDYKAQTAPVYRGQMLVLANGGSASSSEVLAGALRDNKRARIVGQKTFGKALVQRVIDIDDGKTGFAMTIRKYYTPAGELIQKKGISPDIAVKGFDVPESDKKNLSRAYNDHVFEEFVKTNKEYSDKSRKAIAEYLKSKNLAMSENISSYYLKMELGRYKASPLYDLEFDNELVKALELSK
jgi:carboxyl-terminal processing protease